MVIFKELHRCTVRAGEGGSKVWEKCIAGLNRQVLGIIVTTRAPGIMWEGRVLGVVFGGSEYQWWSCDGLKWFDFIEYMSQSRYLSLPLSITLKGNVLQRDIRSAKSDAANVGRALLPRRRRLLVALNHRAVVGRLVPLDSRPHDCNRPYELHYARGTRLAICHSRTFVRLCGLKVLPPQRRSCTLAVLYLGL